METKMMETTVFIMMIKKMTKNTKNEKQITKES